MQKYECKNCGAELYWDAEANALKCQYCDSEYQPSDFEDKTTEDDAQKKNEELDKEFTNSGSDIGDDMVVYQCEECGAELVTSKTTMATVCAYCGRAISITDKSAGSFRPEKVIPFTVNHENAMEKFKKYIKSSPLTPKKFHSNHVIEKMQGLFVPFWLHSMTSDTRSLINGETSTSSRRGDDKITTYKVYEIDISATGQFKDIPTDASKKMDNNLMDAIEPFSYDKIQEFNPAYMAGYFAEQPDETAEDTMQRAETRAMVAMNEKMIQAAGPYQNKRILMENHDLKNKTSRYAMLPVWLLNVEFNGKKYQYAINGETGKVSGKLPISKIKFTLFSLAGFLGGNIGYFIISMVI